MLQSFHKYRNRLLCIELIGLLLSSFQKVPKHNVAVYFLIAAKKPTIQIFMAPGFAVQYYIAESLQYNYLLQECNTKLRKIWNLF